MSAIQRYSFPGNVRELEHLMERASVHSGGRAITGATIQEQQETPARKNMDPELESLLDLPFHESVARWERKLIAHATEAAHGNRSVAARRLGTDRRLLHEKLQRSA